ncbi:fatty acyl-AMP ligase [Mesorhizobium sp. CN2-181]|uniref:fatty acyl-AMP ligase n=1 Tax=Mesorhizobium yinganensis TaxID=3157707 RepID=UPI0032B82142
MTGAPAASLLSMLRDHAQHDGARPALRFLGRGEEVIDESTYGALHGAAATVAANLAAACLATGPVLLALPQGLDFIRCFFGCVYAGVIAIPTPGLTDPRAAQRIAGIVEAARPAAVIAPAEAFESRGWASLRENNPEVAFLSAGDLLRGNTATDLRDPLPDDVAFLQFTSGSTSRPKGVAITHRNIMANLAMIKAAFGQTESDSTVSWLPLHHDMGLIGCVLEPLYLGAQSILMAPIAFLQRPARWLKAMARFGATTAGAPNFAYEFCARMITDDQIPQVDLSRWRLAFCGSEPIRAATLAGFAQRFRSHGFNEKAFYPCYGLAEATLFVTGGRPGTGVRERKIARSGSVPVSVVSCGTPSHGTSVLLLEPGADQPVPPGGIGEIAVSGDQVSPGFWDPDRGGIVPDRGRTVDLGGRSYLRTGDLGAIVDGELHVVGRLKNMAIIRGTNIYAEDVELTVRELPEAAQLGAVAALPVAADPTVTEGLAIVCEASRTGESADPAPLLQRLAGAVADAHGFLPQDLVIVPAGAIERTLSGKLQRARTAERLAKGELPILARFTPRRPVSSLRENA